MGLLFTLRMLADLALYLCVAGPVGRIFGLSGPPVPALLIMAGCCGVAFALRRAKSPALRLAPFGGLALCGFFVYTPADALVLLPAAGFCVESVRRQLFYSDLRLLRARFGLVCKILPPAALVGILFSRPVIEGFMLPFALIYLAVTVYLLQMLRQSEAVLGQRRYRWLNLGALGVVGVLGLLLSAPAFLSGLAAAVGAVYRHTLAPVLLALAMGIAYVLMGLGWVLAPVFRWLAGLREPSPEAEVDTGGYYDQLAEQLAAGPAAEIFGQALTALAILGLLALAVWVLRRMLGTGAGAAGEAGPEEIRGAAPGRAERPKGRARGPRARVRAVFRRFLRLCRDQGIGLGPDATSLWAVSQAARSPWCLPERAAELREIYIQARYSGREITREDVRLAGACYAAIRAQARKKSP